MKKFISAKKSLPVALGLVAFVVASSASAATQQRQLFMYAPSGAQQSQMPLAQPSEARDAAIHDCSVKSSKYSFSSWQTTQLAVYRSCMAEHNQQS